MKKILHILFFVFALSFSYTGTIKPSYACCSPGCLPTECGCCSDIIGRCQTLCLCTSDAERGEPSKPTTTIGHVTDEFRKHRGWMIDVFFKDPVKGDEPGLLAAMKIMTTQLATIGTQQVEAIGTFFDAKHQLETQRLFQKLTARAHKDYHPSESLCEFGTITRSLASSARNTDLTSSTLARRSVDRQVLADNSVGDRGIESDQASRLVQFIKKYCSKADNAKNLDLLCQKSESDATLYNKDINFTSTIDTPLTLDLDFSDKGADQTDDEEALFALNSNLFSNKLFPPVSSNNFVDDEGNPSQSGAGKHYQDARAVIAKRSVATNSLAAIAALKTKGDEESKPFLYSIIRELGPENGQEILSAEAIADLIGESPSYFAQMEVLTKKLYQNPNFYADLYDKPANVLRKDVTVQAATLMQKRDLYRSYLRSEMILAVMLETALIDEQARVENEVNKAKQEGKAR